MSVRERSDPSSATSPALGSALTPSSLPFSLLLACRADSFWDKWCRQATPEQRQQIWQKVAETGLVHAHQLPPPRAPVARSPLQVLLADLIAGQAQTLEPCLPWPGTIHDEALDDDQRHAVARALASPDLSLIQGFPGCGKSRVVAEVLRQAMKQGRRVLFAAASGAALDCVLGRLQSDLAPSLLRYLGANETLTSLPPGIAPLTLNERVRHFAEQTLPKAQQQVGELRRCLDRLTAQESDWVALRALPAQQEAARARKTSLEQQRDAVQSQVEQAWTQEPSESLPEDWQAFLRQRDESFPPIEAAAESMQRRLEHLDADLVRIEAEHRQETARIECCQGNRWWSLAWWRARKQNDAVDRRADLVREMEAHRAERASLDQPRAELREALARLRAEHLARKDELTRCEITRRLSEIEPALRAAERDLITMQAEGSARRDALAAQGVSQDQTESTWREERLKAERDWTTWQAWLDALEQARPCLAEDFVAACRILAVPVGELLRINGDRTLAGFDLLVVEEAHRLGEKELLSLARLVPSCVLVGEAAVQIPLPSSSRRNETNGPGEIPGSCAFAHVWDILHADPRKVSASWERTENRLTARLRPGAAGQDPEVHREPVFDRPEIELAIHAPPGQEPRIVEVSFPASMNIREAKEFIFRELEELSIHCTGLALHWSECDASIRLHLSESPCSAAIEERVLLAPGIHESLARVANPSDDDTGLRTIELGFDRAAGWDRHSAEGWAGERLGLSDAGRTAVLSRCYRARPDLSAFLKGLLFGPECSLGDSPPAEFIAVPPTPRAEGWSPATPGSADSPWYESATATLAPKVVPIRGAGLEIELGDSRRLDGIPEELRSALPPRGIINYPEARFIIQTLEAMMLDSACPERDSQVAILSLYPAQVELLQLLVQRSPVLSASAIPIRVGLPGLLAHRDCPIVCLGLTRSHASRAVPFSDDPRDLVLALTRATSHLLVFGDPGTMARRRGWFGSLDHLNESAGPVEQALITRLLASLPEREAPVPSGLARESSGV